VSRPCQGSAHWLHRIPAPKNHIVEDLNIWSAAQAARLERDPHHEGQSERQDDLRQVQGDPPSRSGHGDLREPPPQAAPGLIPAARPPRPFFRTCPRLFAAVTSTPGTRKSAVSRPRGRIPAADATPGTEAGDLSALRRTVSFDRPTEQERYRARPPRKHKEHARWHASSESTSPAKSGWRSP
jgi:hypothetical protein